MANLPQNPPNTIPNMFSIVKDKDQNYAEIQSDFVLRHRGQFSEYWLVKKFDADYHKLKWNIDFSNPLILIQGWNKFKEFHNLPDNVEVEMIFHGNNVFEVNAVRELKSPMEMPPFYSKSLHPTRTSIFDFELTNMDVNLEKFWLDGNFGEFLQEYNMNYMVLCGENGQSFYINVLDNHSTVCMKLGYNWDQVCSSLKFKVGNRIRFKFERNGNTVSPRCHLLKLA